MRERLPSGGQNERYEACGDESGVFAARDKKFPLGARTYIMGILNVTPDSFSDGGRYLEPDAAARRAADLMREGADIVDVGGQSTRPGAEPIPAGEEAARVLPALREIRRRMNAPLSVDTYYPEVARAALEYGADIVNDVSGDVRPEMAEVVRSAGAGWVLMYNGRNPSCGPDAGAFLRRAAARAQTLGVPARSLCLDPGFGFVRSLEENIVMLRNLRQIYVDGIAALAGVSRKRFIRASAGENADEEALDHASAVAGVIAIAGGVDILRVHNPRIALFVVRAADYLLRTSARGESHGG